MWFGLVNQRSGCHSQRQWSVLMRLWCVCYTSQVLSEQSKNSGMPTLCICTLHMQSKDHFPKEKPFDRRGYRVGLSTMASALIYCITEVTWPKMRNDMNSNSNVEGDKCSDVIFLLAAKSCHNTWTEQQHFSNFHTVKKFYSANAWRHHSTVKQPYLSLQTCHHTLVHLQLRTVYQNTLSQCMPATVCEFHLSLDYAGRTVRQDQQLLYISQIPRFSSKKDMTNSFIDIVRYFPYRRLLY